MLQICMKNEGKSRKSDEKPANPQENEEKSRKSDGNIRKSARK